MRIKDICYLIVLLVLVGAIYLNALSGRYKFIKVIGDERCMRFDSWTGEIDLKKGANNWESVAVFGLKAGESIIH